VLVTGAGGGIGGATCTLLRSRGAVVVAADLDAQPPAGVADHYEQLDVTDDTSVESAVRGAAEAMGGLDGLVLSHGTTALGPAASTPMAAVETVLAVNLRGAIAVTQAALPLLMASRGRVAVMSSVSGFAPLVHRTAYSASKHGLHGYFDSLRAELHGAVSVTIVAPSFVATGIEHRAAHRAGGAAGAWSTTGTVCPPESIAVVIVDAMARRRRLVLPSRTARLAYLVSRASPGVYERVMRRRVLSD
jgi:NAD(P)-dependent dehydrogenase (short-subunit alcohol dehydrogenase family)